MCIDIKRYIYIFFSCSLNSCSFFFCSVVLLFHVCIHWVKRCPILHTMKCPACSVCSLTAYKRHCKEYITFRNEFMDEYFFCCWFLLSECRYLYCETLYMWELGKIYGILVIKNLKKSIKITNLMFQSHI